MPAGITPAQAAARRLNGMKGGRPKGARSRRTLIMEAAKRRLDEAIAKKTEELLAAQFEIATLGRESPSAANSAIDSLFDRAYGRPTAYTESLNETPRDPVTIVYVYAAGSGPDTAKTLDVPSTPLLRAPRPE